ncbi:hypothetical protein BJX70DRAFT_367618 [Aspergillus crustosus]
MQIFRNISDHFFARPPQPSPAPPYPRDHPFPSPDAASERPVRHALSFDRAVSEFAPFDEASTQQFVRGTHMNLPSLFTLSFPPVLSHDFCSMFLLFPSMWIRPYRNPSALIIVPDFIIFTSSKTGSLGRCSTDTTSCQISSRLIAMPTNLELPGNRLLYDYCANPFLIQD